MCRMFKNVVYLYIFYRIILSIISPAYTKAQITSPKKIYTVTGTQTFWGNPHLNTIVWHTTIPVLWKNGKVILSGNVEGTGFADVGVSLEVYGSDQSKKFIYDATCEEKPMPPLDITHLMGALYGDKTGVSNIFIRYNRKFCYNWTKQDNVTKDYMDISPLYLIYSEEEKTDPFLALPFDHINFEESLLGASSFFDHEFPLLSSGIKEPTENNIHKTLTSFGDSKRSIIPYSSHDGYDFARRSGVKLGTPVLAAAKGTATARWYGGCGQMIEIDHKNGFQTRYCHLSTKNLITTSAPVEVVAGQKIGEVGLTGNTTGAHIHFVVVQDKNNDSHFEDNIPDGITDPLGFMADTADPWAGYSFEQNNTKKTGNKSSYLFTKNLSGGTYTISPEGNKISFSGGDVTIPAQMVKQDNILKLKVMPPANNPKILNADPKKNYASWGNKLIITVHDGFLNFTKNFEKSFRLSFNLNTSANYPFKLETLAIYSSSDGENWEKELNSVLDLDKNVVYADINHLTEFALLGELQNNISDDEISMWQGTWRNHPENVDTLISPSVLPILNTVTPLTITPTPTTANTTLTPTKTQTITPSSTSTPTPTTTTITQPITIEAKEKINTENKSTIAINDNKIGKTEIAIKDSLILAEQKSNLKNSTTEAVLGESNLNIPQNKKIFQRGDLVSVIVIFIIALFMFFWIIYILKKDSTLF